MNGITCVLPQTIHCYHFNQQPPELRLLWWSGKQVCSFFVTWYDFFFKETLSPPEHLWDARETSLFSWLHRLSNVCFLENKTSPWSRSWRRWITLDPHPNPSPAMTERYDRTHVPVRIQGVFTWVWAMGCFDTRRWAEQVPPTLNTDENTKYLITEAFRELLLLSFLPDLLY